MSGKFSVKIWLVIYILIICLLKYSEYILFCWHTCMSLGMNSWTTMWLKLYKRIKHCIIFNLSSLSSTTLCLWSVCIQASYPGVFLIGRQYYYESILIAKGFKDRWIPVQFGCHLCLKWHTKTEQRIKQL